MLRLLCAGDWVHGPSAWNGSAFGLGPRAAVHAHAGRDLLPPAGVLGLHEWDTAGGVLQSDHLHQLVAMYAQLELPVLRRQRIHLPGFLLYGSRGPMLGSQR
jgi:hypothetical protein